jgi:hypothetical protein
MRLSQKRGDAVRMYLITHGVPEDRVTAMGVGKTEPIADNKTAEGRANNRRVEIILNNTPETTGAPIPRGQQQPSPGGGRKYPMGGPQQQQQPGTGGGQQQQPAPGGGQQR